MANCFSSQTTTLNPVAHLYTSGVSNSLQLIFTHQLLTFHDWMMVSHEPDDDKGETRKGEWKYLTLQNILWIPFLYCHWSVVKYHSSTRSFLLATLMPQKDAVISCLEPCFLPNSNFPSGNRFLFSDIIDSDIPSHFRYEKVDDFYAVVRISDLYMSTHRT